MRRLLVLCAVAVTVCATLAFFARAQSRPSDALMASAPDGAIVVTGGPYPAIPLGHTAEIHGILTAADQSSFRALTLTPDRAVNTTFATAPNQIGMPSRLVGLGGMEHPSGFAIFAGNGKAGFGGDGGLATSAEFDLVEKFLAKRSGITVAEDGTLFIADTKNSTIRAVAGAQSSEPGIIRSVAGKWAPTQNVQLVEPMGIAVDRGGNLFIADHAAGTVSMLSKLTGQLRVLAHVASPASLTVTRDGSKVFVASPETGGVFAIKTLDGSIDTVAGFTPSNDAQANGGPCAALEQTVSVAANSTEICLAGIAADGRGNLFVADANTGRILRVDAASGKISTAVSGLITPGDIAFDAQGDLFVSEQGRNRILAMAQIGDASGNLQITTPTPPACPQGASFTYCNEPSGGTSASFAFTLTNLSASTISGITITPAFVPAGTNPPPPPTNFTTTSTSCTGMLAAGANCVINVAFTPLAAGAINGQLVVSDSAPADTVTVNLAGTGDDFNMQIVNGQPTEVTVHQGGTATFMAQLNAVGVFGQNGEQVSLVCPLNLPAFATCAFMPCPIKPTVGGTTTFSIVIVTSSTTVQAPEVPNPCNSPAAAFAPGPRGAPPMMRVIGERLERIPPFPALLAILVAVMIVLGGMRALPRSKRAFAGVALVIAMAGGGLMLGCGGGGNNMTKAFPTPIAITTMNVVANATDSNGNPLNASRGLQITLDVIK